MASITLDYAVGSLEEIEVLESYVLNSRVHTIIDNPMDEMIPEG